MALSVFRWECYVGGVRRQVLAPSSTTHSLEMGVASADLTLDPAEGRPAPGDSVRVRMGYPNSPGSMRDYFTGEIPTDGLSLWPNLSRVRCLGYLARATEGLGELKSYANTAEYLIIDDLLTAAGVVAVGRSIAAGGLTLGTAKAVTLAPTASPLALIQEIARLLVTHTPWDGPDGVVRFWDIGVIPASTAARVLTQVDDLAGGEHTRSTDGMANIVTCIGSPDVDPQPEVTVQATLRSPYLRRDKAETPFQTALAESTAVCQTYCERRVLLTNRLQAGREFTVPGDATLAPGMTIAIDSAAMQSPAYFRYRIQGVRQALDGSIWLTHLTLFGGDPADGLGTSNVKPVAAFTFTVEQETLADGTTITVVLCDASASYSLTGTLTDRAWTTNQGTVTELGDGTRAVVRVVGANPSGLVVGLTVTDSNGLTRTLQRAIDVDEVPVLERELWAAAGARLKYYSGGAWQSVAVAAVGVVEQSADTFTLVWTATGVPYKVSVPNKGDTPTVGALSGPTGVTAGFISLGYVSGGTQGGRCWLGTSSGQVWFSANQGDDWQLLSTVPNGASISYIEESPAQANDVALGAGNVAYRGDGTTWRVEDSHPNTALTIRRTAAGFGHRYGAWAGTAVGGEAARIRERDGATTGDFAGGSKPVDVTGMSMAIEREALFLVDAEGRSWVGEVVGGAITYTQKTWPTGTLGTPRHDIRDGELPHIVYFGADGGVGKTVDEMATVEVYYLAAGDEDVTMVGYGRLANLNAFEPPAAPPSSENIALASLGVTATQSTVAGGGTEFTGIIDANPATFFHTSFPVAGQWMRVDFGAATTIAAVRVIQAPVVSTNNATAIAVESSTDAATWTLRHTLDMTPDVTDSGSVTLGSGLVSARYWRIRATAGGVGGWVVYTLELYPPQT